MSAIIQLIESSLNKVLLTFAHNWPYLLASIVVGTLIKLYLDKDRVAAYLQKHQKGGVGLATAVAVGTPLCSCGTTAIVIGMMASLMPWAPIVAFMVASPLSSPEGMVYTAGLFGWPFALAGFIGSILLGLAGGAIAGLLDRAGWLKNQARFRNVSVAAQPLRNSGVTAAQPFQAEAKAAPVSGGCGCGSAPQAAPVMALQAVPAASSCGCGFPAVVTTTSSCGCGAPAAKPVSAKPASGSCGCGSPSTSATAQPTEKPKVTLKIAGQQFLQDAPKLLIMFFSFAFLGYLINGLIPETWIPALFGAGHAYSVPLAATLGLPFYINSEGSLPLIRAMLDSGMSQGAALAFLIAGSGTSIGAIAGALTIAKWRVIAIVVGTLWAGAIVLGLAFDLMLATGLI